MPKKAQKSQKYKKLPKKIQNQFIFKKNIPENFRINLSRKNCLVNLSKKNFPDKTFKNWFFKNFPI